MQNAYFERGLAQDEVCSSPINQHIAPKTLVFQAMKDDTKANFRWIASGLGAETSANYRSSAPETIVVSAWMLIVGEEMKRVAGARSHRHPSERDSYAEREDIVSQAQADLKNPFYFNRLHFSHAPIIDFNLSNHPWPHARETKPCAAGLYLKTAGQTE